MAPVSAVASFLVWLSVPWLLLDRRVGWRRLIPSAALTTAGTSLYGVASTVYMPRLLATYSGRYGLFGVTLALVGWLLCIALIIVASTAVASVFDRARPVGPTPPSRAPHRAVRRTTGHRPRRAGLTGERRG